MKRNPQMGAVLVEQKEEEKKNERLASKTGAIIWAIEMSGALFICLFVVIVVHLLSFICCCCCHCHLCVMGGSSHVTGHCVLLASSVGASTRFK